MANLRLSTSDPYALKRHEGTKDKYIYPLKDNKYYTLKKRLRLNSIYIVKNVKTTTVKYVSYDFR